jgi:hypothetical protein
MKNIAISIPPLLYRSQEFDICMAIEEGPVININKGTIRV